MLRPVNYNISGYVNTMFRRIYIGDGSELLKLYNETNIRCNNISDSVKSWRLEC